MTYYKEEKKRIGIERWIYVVLLWLLYFFKDWAMGDGGIFRSTWDHFIFFYFVVVMVTSTNNSLFFVKEQGKRTFIMKKYEIIPIPLRELYRVKIRILAETVAVFIAGMIGIRMLMLALFQEQVFSLDMLWWTLYVGGFTVIYMTALVFFVDIVRGERRRKKHS